MNLVELVSLTPVWDFLSTVLSDIAKARFKQKSSAEVARRRAFALYETLGRIKLETDFFVSELQVYVQSVGEQGYEQAVAASESINAEPFELRGESVRQSAKKLMKLLDKLADDLDLLSPQLEIHQPLLTISICDAQLSRSKVIGTARALLAPREDYFHSRYLEDASIKPLYLENKKSLKRLIVQANRNRLLIGKAVDEYRAFLAEQFPFKESF